MYTDVDVFRYNGKRYAVSYQDIKLSFCDPGRRLTHDGKYTRVSNGRRISTDRKAVLVIVRQAYTGIPYSGIAILHPLEKRSSDRNLAMKLATKRAIRNLCDSEQLPPLDPKDGSLEYIYGDPYEYVYRAYREAMLEKYNPTAWSVVLKIREDEKIRKDALKNRAKRKKMVECIEDPTLSLEDFKKSFFAVK